MSSPFPILGITVLERGWLSSNNVVIVGKDHAAVIDTGYTTHASQTIELVRTSLSGRSLQLVANTHLHSDHCGGNAALKATFRDAQILIPPGLAHAVRSWDTTALTFEPTGQACDRFGFDGLLQPGQVIPLGDHTWEVHAARGHDPHSVVLFEPHHRVLISADALWENGFGVVFPEIEGLQAFEEVAATLDVIEALAPLTIVPGHGGVFTGVAAALDTARRRLDGFVRAPERHALYAAKVLLKYRLLDWQRVRTTELLAWLDATPYFGMLHAGYFSNETAEHWSRTLVDALVQSGAAQREGEWVHNA